MEQHVFLQKLQKAGINTDQAIGRFMGNTSLFLQFVRRLPQALRFEDIRRALEAQTMKHFICWCTP